MACMGGALLAAFLEGCSAGKEVNGTIDRSDLVIPVSSFQPGKKYLVVSHERLKYPVCVYRFSDDQYVALLMRCTHQGAELQVFGDRLQCPAHGSEFNNKGIVQNGPADTNLRTFPVSLQHNQLHISLQ
ncbi:nitrite reductase/ring-hydroxylating ferredoxin subunit [Dinghuibacter silviterrae]|uniref:Nitrite reductase/ring-hydroxylating ferredoxin subunit n=2 Tax=Dinghuibacter silviterrae TaxID=1539049 RepID=A0A4R8DNY8_9BACT|nr:nitrite reductase/ring-hydroxylating ferredoxin subunit [Dinghuibacter silviterrae]